MFPRRIALSFCAGSLMFAAVVLPAQTERHGRKYKAPPETTHLEVLVVKDTNGKILENAAVIFHPTKDGVSEGNLEVKTGPDGKAFIDIIPKGSDVTVQVISSGFSTYADNIKLDTDSKAMTIRMKRPQAQISAYDDSQGGPSTRKAGVQEPARHDIEVATPKPLPASAPVISLPSLPKNSKAKGDATVPSTGPGATQVQPPTAESSPTTPATDGGTAGSSQNR